jgi:hypothetical protein
MLQQNTASKQEHLQKRLSMGGTLDLRDTDLLHQVLINCNYLNVQDGTFLPKNAHQYREYNLGGSIDSMAAAPGLSYSQSRKKLTHNSLITYRDSKAERRSEM